MGLLSSLFGRQAVSADASTEAPAGEFCTAEFPKMWGRFVDHVVDTAYSRSCTAVADPQPAELPPLRLPAAKRLVAIGDLHGDLDKATRAFKLAGLIDERGVWSGGDTVCVQVGDILDRGDHELKLLYMLERLQRQAAAAGGALWVLNGNHETMNVGGNFRYATKGADLEMAAWRRWVHLGEKLRSSCSSCSSGERNSMADVVSIDAASIAVDTPVASSSGRSSKQFNPLREAALRPGGPIARRFFAPHPTVLQVGSTLFVHGGVLPSHVEYGLERINTETRAWLMGEDPSSATSTASSSSSTTSSNPTSSISSLWSSSSNNSSSSSSSGNTGNRKYPPPAFLRGADAVVWARNFSARDESRCDCDTLQEVLQSLPGARRMVVGHTIQDRGINEACGGQVLRVDVGLSKGCGNGEVQVLEILADGQQILRLSEGKEAQVLDGKQRQQVLQQVHAQQQQALPPQQQRQQQQPAAVAHHPQHQQRHHHQQQQVEGSGSWLMDSWRSLWQESQQSGAVGMQGGKHEDSRNRVDPTPA